AFPTRRSSDLIKALDDDDCVSRGGRHAEQAVLLIELDPTARFYLGEWAWRVPIGSRSIGAVDSEERRPDQDGHARDPPCPPHSSICHLSSDCCGPHCDGLDSERMQGGCHDADATPAMVHMDVDAV